MDNVLKSFYDTFHFKPTVHIRHYSVQYINAVTIYGGLFHLLNTVLNILNVHIHTVVSILRESRNCCR